MELDIDLDLVRVLASKGSPLEEIAAYFRIKPARLEKDPDVMAAIEYGMADGKMKLREAQYEEAVDNRNTAMLKWLGANMLGQTDKPPTKHETKIEINNTLGGIEFELYDDDEYEFDEQRDIIDGKDDDEDDEEGSKKGVERDSYLSEPSEEEENDDDNDVYDDKDSEA